MKTVLRVSKNCQKIFLRICSVLLGETSRVFSTFSKILRSFFGISKVV